MVVSFYRMLPFEWVFHFILSYIFGVTKVFRQVVFWLQVYVLGSLFFPSLLSVDPMHQSLVLSTIDCMLIVLTACHIQTALIWQWSQFCICYGQQQDNRSVGIKNDTTLVWMLSDSLSIIKKIDVGLAHTHWVESLQTATVYRVTFMFIPGHVGVMCSKVQIGWQTLSLYEKIN